MAENDNLSFRLRVANWIAGRGGSTGGPDLEDIQRREFVQPLSPIDGWSLNGTGRLNQYYTKPEQLQANVGWVYAANASIADPASAVPLTLFHKTKSGKREQIFEHELLDLINAPNFAHTGEQLRQLHYTYMNLTGESYILMLKGDSPFQPAKAKLPDALQILPTHRLRFKLGKTYTKSTVEIDKEIYPVTTIIRDLNPDPANPYYGRSVIAAAAPIIDTENQMLEWNRRFFANNARPSLVFESAQEMSNDAYARWKQQFMDTQTGTENAFQPLLIEGGKATPYMLGQSELEFLGSRKFSMTEILSMFRVSPGMLGQVENVNRANLEAGFYIHALVNIVPRVRQFVKQLNATLVSVYDPDMELDFENPVPEDVAQKLNEVKGAVNQWLTIDEARDAYGMKPLPNGLGSHIVIPGKDPMTLDEVVNGEPADAESGQNPEDPDDNNDDDLDEDPSNNDPEASKQGKSLTKASSPRPVPEGHYRCECCAGYGEHDTALPCTRCEGAGYVTPEQAKRPIPCENRADFDNNDTLTPEWNPDVNPDKALSGTQARHEAAHAPASSADDSQAALPARNPQRAATAVMDVRANSPPNPMPELTDPNEQAAQSRQERGDAKINLYSKQAETYIGSMLTALHAQFEMQRSEVMAHAQGGGLRKSLAKATKAQQRKRKQDWLAGLLGWSSYNDSMRKALAPILYTLIAETGKQATAEVGLDPSQFNATTPDILNYQMSRAQKIASEVDEETEKQLRASLSQGIDNDESDNDLNARIEAVFGAALTKRAFNIAQWEVTRTQGFADNEAWKQAGNVSGSEWVVQSNNPCPICLSLDGVIVSLDSNFYSLGDVATADGKTLHISYESIPYPPLHNRCECIRIPVMIA